MSGEFVIAYAHLVGSVLLVGYALYWTMMALSLRRHSDPAETQRLLQIANCSRWPHVVVPWRWRLPLPLLGWALFACMLVTGIPLSLRYPLDTPLSLKIALVLGLIAIQVPLTRRPRPGLSYASFVVTLAIVVLSGLLARW